MKADDPFRRRCSIDRARKYRFVCLDYFVVALLRFGAFVVAAAARVLLATSFASAAFDADSALASSRS
jgi:hypothetical protein